jgi:hypothetical protein
VSRSSTCLAHTTGRASQPQGDKSSGSQALPRVVSTHVPSAHSYICTKKQNEYKKEGEEEGTKLNIKWIQYI